MLRAYSALHVNQLSDDDAVRAIAGMATTPTPDRYGDVVNPLGAKFAVPLPLLWQHDAQRPVGLMEFAAPSKAGIGFRATLAAVAEPGALRDRVDEAWQSIKYGLVRAVSIGFRPLKYAFLDDGGIEFQEWEFLELSLVTIPANAEAVLDVVKSADRGALVRAGGTSDDARAALMRQRAVNWWQATRPAAGRRAISLMPGDTGKGAHLGAIKLNRE